MTTGIRVDSETYYLRRETYQKILVSLIDRASRNSSEVVSRSDSLGMGTYHILNSTFKLPRWSDALGSNAELIGTSSAIVEARSYLEEIIGEKLNKERISVPERDVA